MFKEKNFGSAITRIAIAGGKPLVMFCLSQFRPRTPDMDCGLVRPSLR